MMTDRSQDNGKIFFPNRDGIGKVVVHRSDLAGQEQSGTQSTTGKDRQSSLPPEVPTVQGSDGRTYVLIDRGDGFYFRVAIPVVEDSSFE